LVVDPATRWLDRHAGAPCVAGPAPARVAWLTGQSDWRRSHLSPAQLAVLDALAEDGWMPLRLGFPWTAPAAAGEYRRAPLPAASLRNAVQHLAARPGSRFARQVAGHLQPLLDRTSDRLLLLCGSTGAQMLGAAAPLLAVPPGLRVQVVALGPVGRLPRTGGAWEVRVVRGDRDLISRWGHRGAPDVLVPGGHLDAATGPAAVAAVRALAVPPDGAREPGGRPAAGAVR
jgi:hypothetical protein